MLDLVVYYMDLHGEKNVASFGMFFDGKMFAGRPGRAAGRSLLKENMFGILDPNKWIYKGTY